MREKGAILFTLYNYMREKKFKSIQYNIIQYITIKYHTKQYNKIQINKTQYKASVTLRCKTEQTHIALCQAVILDATNGSHQSQTFPNPTDGMIL